MKLPIIFLAVLGLTFGKSIPTHSTKNLQDDLNDFLALVPVDDILAIALDYLANDAQVQELMVYVQSEEFHTIILTVEALPEFDNFVNFLNDLGLDVTGYINTIHNVIGLPPFPTSRKHMRRGVGVDGLIDDVIAILPVDDLKALFEEKLVSSPDFKAFYDAIGSPEFQSIIQTLNAMPEYQALLDKLRDYGVDVDHYIELIRALFGLTKKSPVSTRNLQDDLNDFLALVPVDQVVAIALDYLANDAQVQELVAYVQTEEFHSIILTVEALPEFSNFVSFLNDLGLDVTGYINSIHNVIGLPPYPASRKHLRRGVGVDGLIDDIIAILPVDDLKALFEEKLVSSPDFKAFYDAIGSPEFQSIIQTLNALPEYQALLDKLRDYGVDVDHYIELIRALFGLTKKSPVSTRNLQDDLNDFLALVPVDQVVAIALDYLANDAQVQELVAYVQTEEFHSIILTVEALPEFSNFVSFLNDLGLDVTGYINSIHNVIGLPPYPASRKHLRRGEGVDGLIDDIIAILPVDDLKALFEEKLVSSPDFKAFYDAIGSPEFQSIIQTLNALPEYQALLDKLRDYGVDVDHYIELIRALFGLTKKSAIGTKNLQDDLNDFLALVPVDQVVAIALDYLANDAQVQELVAYVQTEEFHSIILTVEALPEFSNFVSFLNDLGLDVTGYINSIHNVIGLPPYPASRKHLRRGEGVDGLIDDIIAILPVDDLKALFEEKLVSSPDFKAFYDAIGSPEFQSIIQTLNALPEYQALLDKLRDYGVDVDHYIELIRALFGLTKKSAIGTKNLQDDLNDFLALVPVDQVVAIALDYLANDAQVQELVAYVQTEEFHSIILTVEALPEFSNFVSFLNDLGLDVTGYINSIHNVIGLPPYPASRKHLRRGEGVDGLIDDIIAILPVDDLKALFEEKLVSSPDFKAFYDAIGSPEFQSIIQTLNALPEYQALLDKLRDYGVDVDHYIELIRALFGLTKKSAVGTKNLQDDLNDLLALLPVDQILSIALDYLANDAQVQEVMVYLQGDEFQSIVLTIEALPEFGNFLNFVKEHGLDVVQYINILHDLLGIPPYNPVRRSVRRGVGINGLIEDIVAVIPIDQLLALYQDKLQTSADFQALYEEIHSAEFLTIIDTLKGLQAYQDLLQKLRDYGVDVDYYIDLIKQLLGFSKRRSIGTKNLQDDLNDLLALLPVDQILSIALDYLANDAQVQEAMVYLQGDEFQSIVLTIEALPEFGNFLNFVKEHGLDVVQYINILHDLLGIPPYNPVRRSVRRGVGINGLIEDIVAVIPVDQLLALFQDKLQNSADFQALYEEIHSAEFLTIIDTLKGLQAYQDLLQKLRDYGVDVDYYIDLIKQLLGFSKRRSTKNLQDDLNDLIALLPIDQILSIALDYLANDAQVQEVMVYLQGDEFQSIVLTIEALPEFGNFLNFVKEHGLDVVQYINVLHDLLGIPPYNPARRSVRRGVGINGLIEDIVAVVPVDQLLALFQDKLQNSADFQALYEEIHSAEFLTIIDTLKGLQEYQDLLQKLRDYGVDVDYYIDLIKQLLGFTKY